MTDLTTPDTVAERRADRLRQLVRCPMCGNRLEPGTHDLYCVICAARYPVTDRQMDLRLTEPKRVRLEIEVGRPRPMPALRPIPMAPDRRPIPIPEGGSLTHGNGLTPALFSWFPELGPEATMLDLGCGDRRFERACAVTGACYVGLDVDGDAPDVLGTGEALPFADESIDFVLSIATLPHTEHPSLTAREIRRVLRPGARFIGTSQFLEPCLMTSRHHASAFGVIDWLDDAGLEIVHLEPNREWDGFMALMRMGYLPSVGLGRAPGLWRPIQRLHRRLWRTRPSKSRQVDGKTTYGHGSPEAFTAGFRFIARKRLSAEAR